MPDLNRHHPIWPLGIALFVAIGTLLITGFDADVARYDVGYWLGLWTGWFFWRRGDD